jgi:putative surface-exposed virulence protein
MEDKKEKKDSDTIKGGANRKGLAGNLGDQVPDDTDNVLRMGAAALTGMGAESQVERMSGGGDSFMAIGGSEGYTGDDTSGGGADPYGDERGNEEEGSGTGSGVGAGARRAGGGTGNDLASEEGYDREADGGGGAGLGAGGLRRGDGNRPDTSASPGGLGTDD